MNFHCRLYFSFIFGLFGFFSYGDHQTSIVDIEKYREFLVDFDLNLGKVKNKERISAFKQTLEFIESSNNRNATYITRLNHFADWTTEEIRNMFPVRPSEMSPEISMETSYGISKSTDLPIEINWASSSNPLGQSALSGVHDQGLCGACWAFVAAEATEATIAIQTGVHIPLSVQELLDCDSSFNNGCNGGNPAVAYKYIVTHGLASAYSWPYKGRTAQCPLPINPSSVIKQPTDMASAPLPQAVGSIGSYVVLPSRNEAWIKEYVGSTGPVSVGICGTDLQFMYYGGGIFNPPDCCTTLNHAVLVVGYGHDLPSGLDYWIVQNSWGSQWGENGYMRVLRTGSYFSEGTCGLAINPSIPIDGFLKTADGQELKRYSPKSLYYWIDKSRMWLESHMQVLLFTVSGVMLCCSIVLFLYGIYLDYSVAARREQPRGSRESRETEPLLILPQATLMDSMASDKLIVGGGVYGAV